MSDVPSRPPSAKRKAKDQSDGPSKRPKPEEQLLTAIRPFHTALKGLEGLPGVDSLAVILLIVAVEGILAGQYNQEILKSLETSIETPTKWPLGTSGELCSFSETACGLTMNVQPTKSNKSGT
jgi:hypothetical protein